MAIDKQNREGQLGAAAGIEADRGFGFDESGKARDKAVQADADLARQIGVNVIPASVEPELIKKAIEEATTDTTGTLSAETLEMLETLNIDPKVLINRDPHEIKTAMLRIFEDGKDPNAMMNFNMEVAGSDGEQPVVPD